jgi:hypothetical protein
MVLFGSCFLVTNCNTNDDGFYQNVFFEANNLVTIQTQTTYSVGDYLYIDADFSRYLPDNQNLGALLDIYKTTTGATQYGFSYVIEKRINASDWEVISVADSQLDINKGSAQNGGFVLGICQYNSADETYEYNVGFPLLSSGNYRLSFGYNSTSSKVELRSVSQPKNLVLNINSTITGLDDTGYYNFVVN